jgi:hypothetical protein
MARRRILEHRLVVAATLAMVLAGFPALTGHVRAALATTTTTAPDEVTASADAEAQGVPVEAMSDRTQYAQVFANPDGTFTYNASPVPQWAQQPDGTWSAIDTTLRVQSDGSIAPAVSAEGLVLSGGGAGPMLTLSQSSGTLALTWPDGALPAPTLSGSTATYASVLPGVDLQMTATPTGVAESLVVKSAQAAANSALSSLAFGLGTSGLTAGADVDGGMSATDSTGAAVFDVPAPQMWDSAGGDAGPSQPGPISNVAAMPITLQPASTASIATPDQAQPPTTTTSVTLTPSASLLTGSSTVYPVYIDPEVTVHGPQNGWLDVGKNTLGQNYGDWEPSPARVGVWCQPDQNGNCGSGTEFGMYRSYFDFKVPSQIWGAQQVSATLFTTETYAWSCSAREVDLYQTDRASRGAIWSTQPARRQFQSSQNVAHGWSSASCPAHGVSFNASGAAKSAASNHWSDLTLELQASDSAERSLDQFSWKKFEVSQFSQPFLQINYDHAPDTPTATTTLDGSRSLGCAASGTWITTTTPSFQARITDPDGQNVKATFHYAKSTGSPSGNLPPTSFLGSGSTFTERTGALADGTYSWDVFGNDGTLSGPTSSDCSFSIDTSRPATPTISSSNYVSGQATNPVGMVGTFTFSDPGNRDPADGLNDVTGYRYGFTNPPLNFVAAAAEGGSATAKVSPVWLGSRTLYVQAVDRAGNLSPDDASNPPAEFNVATIRPTGSPTPLLAEWKLGEGSGTAAADATGNGHDATLGAQAGWGGGRVSGTSALSLAGAGDSEAVTASQLPPVDNTGSFTVSAWVKLSPGCASTPSSCGFYDPVSMDGVTQGAFALEYVDQTWCQPGAGDGVHGCWAFSMSASDTTSPPGSAVEAATTVSFGTWVHLTGVFDQVHQTIQIYVNGQPEGAYGPVTGVQPWAGPAMGSLRIGRVLFNGGAFNWWPGEVSDVCTFWGVLDNTQIANVFNSGCASAGAP